MSMAAKVCIGIVAAVVLVGAILGVGLYFGLAGRSFAV